MLPPDAVGATAAVIEALRTSGQRGVLAAGWGGLGAAGSEPDAPDPFMLDHAPHAWLFPRMAAVVHHCGAGTTAAAARAGVPSVGVPFYADQPFWARRLHAVGAAPRPIPFPELSAATLAAGLESALHDSGMRRAAERLGQLVRAEGGVATAVAAIETYVAGAAAWP